MLWVVELKLHIEVVDPPEVNETPVGLHDPVRPVDGVIDIERPTVPEKPPRLVRVIVDELLEPDRKFTAGGLAEIV